MLSNAVAVVIALAVLCHGQQAQRLGDRRNEQLARAVQIRQQLQRDYDSSRRPDSESADFSSLIVSVNAYIVSARQIDAGTTRVSMYFRQRWKDAGLAFEDATGDFANGLLVPNDESDFIWRPDTYLVPNAKNSGKSLVTIEPEGDVLLSEMLTVDVPCEHNLAAGSSACELTIASYEYPLEDVWYYWRPFSPVEYADGAGVASATTANCTGEFENVGSYSCLRVTLRTASCWSSTLRYGVTAVVLVAVSYLHFWLGHSWVVGRALSALLPVHVLTAVVLAGLVPTATSTQLIWWALCIGFAFASAVLYFLSVLGHTCRCGGGSAEAQPLNSDVGRDKMSPLDVSMRLLFPVVFVICVALYVILLGWIFA